MIGLLTAIFATSVTAATISGTVTDPSGKPVQDARVDHTGKMVVVSMKAPPSQYETRTTSDGRFRITTGVAATVLRKPGYQSQRVLIGGDAELQITLTPLKTALLCKQSSAPTVKTRSADDVDYSATWFYIETKDGNVGILAGHGPMYSFGAPSDSHVWTSLDYFEVMYENGMIDASGRSIDGKYWRSRTIFGAAAQYYHVTRELAEQLDCVMDRINLP